MPKDSAFTFALTKNAGNSAHYILPATPEDSAYPDNFTRYEPNQI